MKTILFVLRHHLLPILIGSLLLTAALFTRLPSWGQLSGLDQSGDGRVSIINVIKAVSSLTARMEKDFNGHFTAREQIVHAGYRLRMNALGDRDFHDVLVGKAGWLYYTGEENLDYYQGAELMKGEQIDDLLRRLARTRDELAGEGIAFYIVVAPNKESIYPEYLPDEVRLIQSKRLLDRILRTDQAGTINFIDLRPVLREAKSGRQVYYRTDTHWNPEGAFAAYEEITRILKKDFLEMPVKSMEEFRRVPEAISGDLAAMLTMGDSLAENSFELEPLFQRRAEIELTENADVRKSAGGDPSLPRAMIFHDSFFNGLQPFLMESFSEAVLVHAFKVDLEWVKAEKPDVVILEVAERYLPEL